MQFVIGLDLSIKSTGVCVRDTETGKCSYSIIAAKLTKAQQQFKHKNLEFLCYFRDKTSKDDSFAVKEQKKTVSVWNVTEHIRSIIKKWKKKGRVSCVIEGISYGSSSSAALADLAGLNYAVRCMLMQEGVSFRIAAPMQLKKFAVGNGGADKDMMTDAWKRCQPEMADIAEIKDDDIADAYFLSVWDGE